MMKAITLVFSLGAVLAGGDAYAEALSTTSVGIANRTITTTAAPVKAPVGADASSGTTSQKAIAEKISGTILCHRISTPSSALGLEIGAGGCMQVGGLYSFANSVSAHLMLIYYPFASRLHEAGDSAIRMKMLSFSNFYLTGIGGFSKITHRQVAETNSTLSTDTLDVGFGVGYSYRLFQYVALGGEAYYEHGSILSSKTATGETSVIVAAATITVFL